MISFASDYVAGAHPLVLNKLVETNMEILDGYGSDEYCLRAAEKIKHACNCPDGEVFFLVGGTQTNQIVINTMLDSHEGVIAVTTGHVSSHEAGAIEFSGHKVIETEGKEGKLDASMVRRILSDFWNDGNHDHMVFPGMVYISFPTEYGTIYKKSELIQLYNVCKEYKIPLYIDGARLGYGLNSSECDLKLSELSGLCDVFYIGGTKMGALCGEAIVFTHNNTPKHFITKMKQHGGLLAKGRLLGIQFDTLFTDDLYMKIGKYAIDMAEKMKDIFREKGYPFYIESPTNQQFIVMDNRKRDELQTKIGFSFWEKYDTNHSVVRFATSWSTRKEDLRYLKEIM